MVKKKVYYKEKVPEARPSEGFFALQSMSLGIYDFPQMLLKIQVIIDSIP